MKHSELTFGTVRSGPFNIYIGPCAFDTRSADDVDYFAVMVSQPIKGDKPPSYFIHLVNDLGWFSWMAKFERLLRPEEVIEYNYYMSIKHMTHPVWKLSSCTLTQAQASMSGC